MKASEIIKLIKKRAIHPEEVMLLFEEDTDLLEITRYALSDIYIDKYAGYAWKKAIITYPEKALQAVKNISLQNINDIISSLNLFLWKDYYKNKNLLNNEVINFFFSIAKTRWEEMMDGIKDYILFLEDDSLVFMDLIPKSDLILTENSKIVEYNNLCDPSSYLILPKFIVYSKTKKNFTSRNNFISPIEFASKTGAKIIYDKFWSRVQYIEVIFNFEIKNNTLILTFDFSFDFQERTWGDTKDKSESYLNNLNKQIGHIFKPIEVPVKCINVNSSTSLEEIFNKIKGVESCTHQQ